jgi:imidazole glycerol-phosphate synthase subunit HisF
MNKKKKLRLISRLDIKGENLIKGIHLEGLRVIGSPYEHAVRYYNQGSDELIFMDCVASLYGRNNITDIIKKITQDVFIPITVGGGIRSLENVSEILRSGADKVAINTAAVKNPNLIKEIVRNFGSQCLVLSVEAKKIETNKWEAYMDNGREPTGLNVIEWIKTCIDLGIGEILVTSIDNEGTNKGFDVNLIKKVTEVSSVPVIGSGGMGMLEHAIDAFNSNCDAIAAASILHYKHHTIQEIRDFCTKKNFYLRHYE